MVRELHPVCQKWLADYTASEDFHLAPKLKLCYANDRRLSTVYEFFLKKAHTRRMEVYIEQTQYLNPPIVEVMDKVEYGLSFEEFLTFESTNCPFVIDRPTPLPLFGDDGKNMTILPHFDDPADDMALLEDESGEESEDVEDMSEYLDMLLAAALNDDMVTAARGFVWQDKIVVAALTKPFYQKSVRDEARRALNEELAALAPDNQVLLCFDMDIYRRITQGLNDEQKEALFKKAVDRL